MPKDLIDSRAKAGVALRLSLTRSALGLDQASFASGAGIKKSTYNQYENGVNMPNLEAATRLRDTYRLTLDWIYLGDDGALSNKLATTINALWDMRSGKPSND